MNVLMTVFTLTILMFGAMACAYKYLSTGHECWGWANMVLCVTTLAHFSG